MEIVRTTDRIGSRGRAQRTAMAVQGVREVENILEVAEH